MPDAPKRNSSVIAKKSFRDAHVALGITLKAPGWPGDSIQVNASTELTTDEARELARAIAALADEADAKVERKTAAEARRRKWRDREVAAGRKVMFGADGA